MPKWHYVYYSYEPWGRGYIGKRSSNLPPDRDPYMGSYRDKTFKPTEKIVLACFEAQEEALQAEVLLHDFYQVDQNSHFANQAKQLSTGFQSSSGNSTPRSEEFRSNMSIQLRKAWQDPAKRERILAGLKRRSQSTQWRENHKKSRQCEDFKETMARKARERWNCDDFRQEQLNTIRQITQTDKWKKAHATGCIKNQRYAYTLISPNGGVHKPQNLLSFCREHGLNQESIRRVATGQRLHHKGWTASRVEL